MKEGAPVPYQFKHHKQISLDHYRGIASDIMRLNDPVADGFMKMSDMRADIVITTKQQERTRDYDQIGNVRVGKWLGLPEFGKKENKSFLCERRDGVWVVAIDDQKLSDEVVHADNKGKRFDEVFMESFKKTMKSGLTEALKNEKLFLNKWPFTISYGLLMANDIYYPIKQAMSGIRSGEDPFYVMAWVVSDAATWNGFWNALGLGTALVIKKYLEQYPDNVSSDISDISDIVYNRPSVRHSVLELPLPPVPVDRFARGWIYLKRHGNKLIQVDTKNQGLETMNHE